MGKKCPSLKRIPGAVHSLLAYPANVFRDYDSFQKREQSSFTTSQTWALPSPALLGVGEPLLLGLLFSQRQGWGRSLDDPRTASLCCGSLRMGPRLRDEGYPPLPATWGTEAHLCSPGRGLGLPAGHRYHSGGHQAFPTLRGLRDAGRRVDAPPDGVTKQDHFYKKKPCVLFSSWRPSSLSAE